MIVSLFPVNAIWVNSYSKTALAVRLLVHIVIISGPHKKKWEAAIMLLPQSPYYTNLILLYQSVGYHFMTRRILRDLRYLGLGVVQPALELWHVLGFEQRPQL